MRLPFSILAILVSATIPLPSHGVGVEPLFQQYCIECHGPDNAEAEIDLTQLLADPGAVPQSDKLLMAVYDVIDFEEMPPAKFDRQPASAERQAMAQWAEQTLQALAARQHNDPGLVVMPRLTQREYDRVIRDLTGQPISAAHLLPAEGGAGEGFSNVGEAQSISLTQLEKYLASAKFVLRHLVATPAGWFWSPIALDKTESTDDVRDNLVRLIRQWYVDEEKAQRPGGDPVATYLEAAWQFRYRQALGLGDATVEAIATRVSSDLQPSILEAWLKILSRDPTELPAAAGLVVQRWLALPGPDGIEEKERRSEFKALDDLLSDVKSRGWQFKYAPDFEVSYEGEKNREKVHDAADDGVWPFEIALKKQDRLYLTLTPAGRVDPEDRVLWTNGRFTLTDGETRSWEPILREASIVEGSIEAAEFEGNPALLATAPTVLRLPVPENAERFTVEARLPGASQGKATVQAMILPAEPDGLTRHLHPARRPIGDIGKQPLKSWVNEMADSRGVARDRIDYSKRPAPLHGTVDESVLAALDLPDGRVEAEELRPFRLLPDLLRAKALPEARQQLDTLLGLLSSLAESPDDPAQLHHLAKYQIGPWMARAWRRPVSEAEADEVLALFDGALAKGESYDAALKQALAAVMLSPHFLYRHPASVAVAPGQATRPLTGLELANRLAFALWASIPDEELLRLGASNALQNPETLQAQARRMLQDPRAAALAEEFAGQWFRFQNFENFQEPDTELFPAFKPEIAEAMHREIETFFDDLIRHDRPITRVLDADYTFVNAQLAEYYDLPEVKGGFQRVSLADTPRRGVATMGAVLTKNASAMRTSPVKRGVYIIEEILGEHLPTPPADVPPLSDGERNAEGQTITEQLAEHRDNPSCSGCHSKFDPLGIALENFDAIGRWREVDSEGEPLAITDTLPDGTTLVGARDLTNYLASQQDRFVAHFCRKLLGYMLGRGVQAGDRALLEAMQQNLAANEYRFSAALDTILQSPQFLQRRWTASGDVAAR